MRIVGRQTFIRPGHLIKVGDEIMFVTAIEAFDEELSIMSVTVVRGVMGTTSVAHASAIPVYIVSPVLKFPAGTKGKNLSIRLAKQKGYIDSIGVVYKPKSIK